MPDGTPHKPTDEIRKQVDAMCGYGVPEEAIAKVIGIHRQTLHKYYQHELETGHIRANAAVAQSLFKKACGNGPQSVTAAIFWLKCRARWTSVEPDVYLGKKEQAELAAKAAGSNADWGQDLHTEARH